MEKTIGNINLDTGNSHSSNVWVTVSKKYNNSVTKGFEITSMAELLDLEYAIKVAIRENKGRD